MTLTASLERNNDASTAFRMIAQKKGGGMTRSQITKQRNTKGNGMSSGWLECQAACPCCFVCRASLPPCNLHSLARGHGRQCEITNIHIHRNTSGELWTRSGKTCDTCQQICPTPQLSECRFASIPTYSDLVALSCRRCNKPNVPALQHPSTIPNRKE